MKTIQWKTQTKFNRLMRKITTFPKNLYNNKNVFQTSHASLELNRKTNKNEFVGFNSKNTKNENDVNSITKNKITNTLKQKPTSNNSISTFLNKNQTKYKLSNLLGQKHHKMIHWHLKTTTLPKKKISTLCHKISSIKMKTLASSTNLKTKIIILTPALHQQ